MTSRKGNEGGKERGEEEMREGKKEGPLFNTRRRQRKELEERSCLPRLIKALAILEQSLAEILIWHRLHGRIRVDRHACDGRGALAEDHEHRFHADRAEGDVGGRQAEGDEQVVALAVGRDGLVLSLGARHATFLPKVWENIPDPADFLRELKRKAGLPGDYWSTDIRWQRYRTEVVAAPSAAVTEP